MTLGDTGPFVRRCPVMESSNDDDAGYGTLAREAEPVRRWLTGFFRRRIRDDDVDDLVQDVFARIVTRDDTTPIGNLAGYVLRTAVNVLTDRARRQKTRGAHLHVVLDTDRHGAGTPDPERIMSGREELHAATAALLSLPERTRTIFILRRLEGCRLTEIAAQLGISVSAVEKHMVRAINHLSTEMEKRNVA
jgi:RNA polymerase sigma factor (sigma-70 family)